MPPRLAKALDEDLLEGLSSQSVSLFVQNTICHGSIHSEDELQRLVIIDLDSLDTRIVFPVVLVREILLLESSSCKFTVAPPRRTLRKYFTEPFSVLRCLQGAVKEQLIHNSAAEEDFTRSVQRSFLSA